MTGNLSRPTAPDADLETLQADLVVVGAGAGGLTVAASVAAAGRSVAVVEVAAEPGGAAALSQGVIWTAPSVAVFEEQDPGGDVETFRAVLTELPSVFDWLSGLGVDAGPELTDVLGFGSGRQIDVATFVQRARRIVEAAQGMVLLGMEVHRLLVEDGRVGGVRIRDAVTGEEAVIRAGSVVLATGGFQGSSERREQLLFAGAGGLPVRSIATARGDGIRLGSLAGGQLTEPTEGFYGHLIPHPMAAFESPDFVPLAQYHSEHGLLLDRDGRRFTDESLGDHINAEVVARRGTALLVIDERIRREHVLQPFIPGMTPLDNMSAAGARGANYVSADDLCALAAAVSDWGYGQQLTAAVAEFNAGTYPDGSPRAANRNPLTVPPYAAIEVQAAITFTYRGLRTDRQGRVLGTTGAVPGLFRGGGRCRRLQQVGLHRRAGPGFHDGALGGQGTAVRDRVKR